MGFAKQGSTGSNVGGVESMTNKHCQLTEVTVVGPASLLLTFADGGVFTRAHLELDGQT